MNLQVPVCYAFKLITQASGVRKCFPLILLLAELTRALRFIIQSWLDLYLSLHALPEYWVLRNLLKPLHFLEL